MHLNRARPAPGRYPRPRVPAAPQARCDRTSPPRRRRTRCAPCRARDRRSSRREPLKDRPNRRRRPRSLSRSTAVVRARRRWPCSRGSSRGSSTSRRTRTVPTTRPRTDSPTPSGDRRPCAAPVYRVLPHGGRLATLGERIGGKRRKSSDPVGKRKARCVQGVLWHSTFRVRKGRARVRGASGAPVRSARNRWTTATCGGSGQRCHLARSGPRGHCSKGV